MPTRVWAVDEPDWLVQGPPTLEDSFAAGFIWEPTARLLGQRRRRAERAQEAKLWYFREAPSVTVFRTVAERAVALAHLHRN